LRIIKKTGLFFHGVANFIFYFSVSNAPHSFSLDNSRAASAATSSSSTTVEKDGDSRGGDYQ
jgi:hypothetical protein